LFQPSQKLIAKDRHGRKVKKSYDAAKTPLQRAIEAGVLSPEQATNYKTMMARINPMALFRQIEELLRQCPTQVKPADAQRKGKSKKEKEAAN